MYIIVTTDWCRWQHVLVFMCSPSRDLMCFVRICCQTGATPQQQDHTLSVLCCALKKTKLEASSQKGLSSGSKLPLVCPILQFVLNV